MMLQIFIHFIVSSLVKELKTLNLNQIIRFPNASTIKYINNLSILKDLYIIGQTIIKIIKPENMYLNPKK